MRIHGKTAAIVTVSNEDCLKTLAVAQGEYEDVIPATLAHWLSVSQPAITAVLNRLKRDGLVRITKTGRVALTGEGRRIARRKLFRHYLIERMLIELFELPWHAVHAEAERLERVVSPEFEKKLIDKLGKNETCPHGNGAAIESLSSRRKNGFLPLSDAAEDGRYQICSVFDRDGRLLQFFDQEGIRPGTAVTVKTQHYDRTTTVDLGTRFLRLGLPATTKIWVKKA